MITTALAETLAMVADAAVGANDDWWIIGSAAVALHGRKVSAVPDVDLLMSAGDARVFLERVGEKPGSGSPDKRFRSKIFGIWKTPPIAVEVMGDFNLATRVGWRPVRPLSRESIRVADRELFVPSAMELAEMLVAFGRAKDLAKAKLLVG